MKKILLLVALCSCVVSAVAQVKCGIRKAYAFYTASMPGVPMTDGKGNPVEGIPFVDHFIYIECKGTAKPFIDSVRYNNLSLAVQVKEVGKKVSPGEIKEGGRVHTIIAKKGNTIWKIEILPPRDKPLVIHNSKNINIKLKYGGSSCEYHLSKETELMAH